MSNYYKPLTISHKHKQLQWINLMVAAHDQYCQCDDSLKHIIIGIVEREPSLKFNKEDSQKLQKCLTTGDHGEHGDEDGDVLGDGDLDRLFAEDVFGETANTGKKI